MTAKEKQRQFVEGLSEEEAREALRYFAGRQERGSLTDLLENAPEDDEPTSAEEEEGVREAREQVERGEVFSAEEIKREIG
jgi:hypothetical protein